IAVEIRFAFEVCSTQNQEVCAELLAKPCPAIGYEGPIQIFKRCGARKDDDAGVTAAVPRIQRDRGSEAGGNEEEELLERGVESRLPTGRPEIQLLALRIGERAGVQELADERIILTRCVHLLQTGREGHESTNRVSLLFRGGCP